jgi:hypothetical protein
MAQLRALARSAEGGARTVTAQMPRRYGESTYLSACRALRYAWRIGSDSMYIEAPKRARVLPYLVFVCVIGWQSSGNSQERYRDIPPNARYSAGEQGWACNNGFRQVGGLCMEDRDAVPSWGAFEVYDGQWRCRSGYHRAGGFCVPATAPAHATYIGDGDHWECDWGFRKVASHCEEIKPPPHAYVDASGHDWVCYPGFERKSDHCVAMSSVAPAADMKQTPSAEHGPDTASPEGRR